MGDESVDEPRDDERAWPDPGTWFGAFLASLLLAALVGSSIHWVLGVDASRWWGAWFCGSVVLYMGAAFPFRKRPLGKVLLGIREFVWFLASWPPGPDRPGSDAAALVVLA